MTPFPFTAIVGMDDMRLALLLNAVSPSIGGVLVRGEKGTAKSTAVRALAEILPDLLVVAECRFSCDPAAPDADCPDGPHTDLTTRRRPSRVVELPVGSTEDRLLGSLDIERALTEGVKSFEPGLLADAHRGVLYVDEVNLLHDHLVDLLLDAAALGTCYVEREGVSVRHAARFLLVGTMNPEEGELRPQLLDRFGLTVEVAAPREPGPRVEVIRRRLAYDADPDGFAGRFADAERDLAAHVVAARTRIPGVELGDDALRQIASVCAAFGVDGLRADIVTARAAIAHAAWHGRETVTADDVRAAARLALPHRRRRNPFDAPGLDDKQLDQALSDALGPPEDDPEPDGPSDGPGGGEPDQPAVDGPDPATTDAPDTDRAMTPDTSERPAGPGSGGTGQRSAAPGQTFRTRHLEVAGVGAGAPGRRSRSQSSHGLTTRAVVPSGPVRRIHLAATLQAAAPHQRERGRAAGAGLLLRLDDLRDTIREGREGNLVLFLVDASGSMAARSRMTAVKGAVLSLLLDAYQRRDKVGLITFRGAGAELALPPTSSVEAAAARLAQLPTGGRTPLHAGLVTAWQTLERERLRDPRRRPLLVVVTDGRHTHGDDPTPVARAFAVRGTTSVVLDCESGPVRLGLAVRLAEALGGTCLGLGELGAGDIRDGDIRDGGSRDSGARDGAAIARTVRSITGAVA